MKNRFLIYSWVLLLGAGVLACNQTAEISDTPTSGTMKISVDESFAPIIDSHVYTFQKIYKYAKVTALYKSEGEVIKDLLQDSARLVVVARKLTPSEMQVFDKIKVTPRVTKVAVDGVALIVHPDNKDTLLAIPQLKDIFTGKKTSWKQINPNSNLNDITIVFDNNNSSTARYVIDSINQKQPLPAKAFASKSNPAVVDYVANNPNAIGVIGVNWVSDSDDSTARGYLKKINVVAVGEKINPGDPDTYYQPIQAYLAEGTYPLKRDLYIISREARAGLGTGFASFVAGDKGQRIILKSGLLPAVSPVRLVQMKEE